MGEKSKLVFMKRKGLEKLGHPVALDLVQYIARCLMCVRTLSVEVNLVWKKLSPISYGASHKRKEFTPYRTKSFPFRGAAILEEIRLTGKQRVNCESCVLS